MEGFEVGKTYYFAAAATRGADDVSSFSSLFEKEITKEKQNKWLLFLYVFSIIQSERCVSFMWIALFKGIDFKEPVYCTVKNVWIWREKKDGVKYCVT